MSAQSTAESNPTSSAIAPGVLVGARFLVESEASSNALGQTFLARDQKTKKPIAVFVLSPALAEDRSAVELCRSEARSAAKLKHRSLVTIYGVGTHGGRDHFIAHEWLSGQPVSELIAEKAAAGRSLSVRGVFNVVAHVCKALGAVHELSLHGALRPQVVWIGKSGRVKLGELGVGVALAKTRRWELLPPEEQAYLAPEIKQGKAPDVRSDVFGVGALLYSLLTARSPIEVFVPPSQARTDVTQELDAVLMRCLALDPAQRFTRPDEIVAALLPLCAEAPEPATPDFDVDVEVDVDIAQSLAPGSGVRRSGVPTGASIPAIDIAIGPTVPPPPIAALAAPAGRPAPPIPGGARPLPPPVAAVATSRTTGIAEATAKLTQNDSPRWMAVKDGMDHGPFTARELIKLIVDGEVLEKHLVFTLSSAERKPLDAYPEFAEFIAQYKIRKEEKDQAVALEHSTKVEKRSTAAKALILAASIGAILVVGLGYFMSRRAAEEREKNAELDLAALYESGQVKISGTAGILQFKPRAGGARRSSGASPGGGTSSGFASYEDAMNQAMELGDATKGGGERQLTSADVAGIMNRSLNRMFSCVGEELRQGGKLGRVTIDVAILGSGKVMGASVSAGSPGFQKCIATKVRELQFPSFPAPRMGARYGFNVD